MTTTKEQIVEAIEGYNLLNEASTATAERWLKIFGDPKEDITSIEIRHASKAHIECGVIEIDTEAYMCSCCGANYNSHIIPLSYIWDEQWEDRERAKLKEQASKSAEEAAQRKAKAEEGRKQERYADFIKMKEEFEGD